MEYKPSFPVYLTDRPSRPTAIIPCAGLGTRMNMSSNQSKEMLIDPNTGKPIIQWSLDLCFRNNIDPVIVTRKEKTDLIEYIKEYNKQLSSYSYVILIILDDIKGEWPETVLASQSYWTEKNFLILPDTRFSPENMVIENMMKSKANIQFALHKVDDMSKWGAVVDNRYCEKPVMAQEVDKEPTPQPGKAWGVIGFHKDCGKELFTNMLQKGKWHFEDYYSIETYNFKSFVDLTRTGTLEKY